MLCTGVVKLLGNDSAKLVTLLLRNYVLLEILSNFHFMAKIHMKRLMRVQTHAGVVVEIRRGCQLKNLLALLARLSRLLRLQVLNVLFDTEVLSLPFGQLGPLNDGFRSLLL